MPTSSRDVAARPGLMPGLEVKYRIVVVTTQLGVAIDQIQQNTAVVIPGT
jgi:hypothetical protein